MEKCKFCQAELPENTLVCPSCGRMNAMEEGLENTVLKTEAVPEEVPAEENTAQPALLETKKATPGKIALMAAAVVVLAAALIAVIMVGMKNKTPQQPAATDAVLETVAATVPADGNPEDVTCKGTYTVSDEEAAAAKDKIVASIGAEQLTNAQLQVYYWSMVNSYLSSEYGYYMMMYGALDYTQPLDTQICAEDESLTWQQFFLGEALNHWQMCVALAGESRELGIQMSEEDRQYLENLTVSLEETAAAHSMTLDELMLNNVGPGAGLEEFTRFQELYMQGKDYYRQELEKLKPTQEELEAYYTLHEQDYVSGGLTRDARYVDARHILVQVKSSAGDGTYTDADWAACEADAQAILDTWLAGEKTEDSFAALATEKTEDPGSQATGGLYENIYEGQMVEPFETWCFDESRVYGDYGLVKTDYGYHVMFFVGTEPMWMTYAESDWVTEKSNAFLAGLTEKYPVDIQFDRIVLGYIDMGA